MIKLSHSQLSQAACGRRWELSYVEGLEKPVSLENEGRMFGSAFHEGMKRALTVMGDNSLMIKGAATAAREYIKSQRQPDKVDYFGQPDIAFDAMLDRIEWEVIALLNWFIPEVGTGRYRVATEADVFPDGDANLLMIEWPFEFALTEEVTVKGQVDAVMVDNETGEVIVVDWKTRDKTIPPATLALIDGQLHLYASVIHAMGGSVDSIRMWQVRKQPPAPVTLVDKGQRPSIAQNAKSTTREMYLATLPEQMLEKYGTDEFMATVQSIRPVGYFQSPTDAPITQASVTLTLQNVRAQARLLGYYKEMSDEGLPLPAQLSSHLCKGCPFMPLCSEPFRYGGDAAALIESLYVRKEGYKPDVDDTEE